jgi:hypothetical protein
MRSPAATARAPGRPSGVSLHLNVSPTRKKRGEPDPVRLFFYSWPFVSSFSKIITR